MKWMLTLRMRLRLTIITRRQGRVSSCNIVTEHELKNSVNKLITHKLSTFTQLLSKIPVYQ